MLMARLEALSQALKREERRMRLAWSDKMEREGWAP